MSRQTGGTRRTLRRLCRGLMACCAAGAACAWPPTAQAGPQYTNNPRFRIPFQSNSEEMQRIGATEVQLHVSTDAGKTWTVAQTVSPQDARFTFLARTNGAYLFAVRTIDKQGQAHPAGQLQPSLSVVVDDQKPQLTLAVSPADNGDMEAVWQADDENLDLSSLRLEYLDATSGVWQPLSIQPRAVGSTRFTSAGGGNVLVRGSVTDLAGNSGAADASGTPTVPTRPAATQPPPKKPDFREPIADVDEASAAQSLLSGGTNNGAMLPMVLPNFGQSSVPTSRTSLSAPGSAFVVPGDVPDSPLLPVPGEPLGTPVSPGMDHQLLASPPLPQDVRWVNSRSFRIDYEVADVGPSGVGSVELYISEDGGIRWFHYGSDPDRERPFDVVVPRDGKYGFAIRVRNGLGGVADPPQPNEAPEIAIVVDQTAPTARLMPLQQSVAGGACQIRISWFTQDDRLHDQPIALFHSTSPEGPWEPITGWMPNQGRYLWTVSTLASRNVYIRLESRDAAGNTTACVSDQPLLIDTSRPTARILDIQSNAPASR